MCSDVLKSSTGNAQNRKCRYILSTLFELIYQKLKSKQVLKFLQFSKGLSAMVDAINTSIPYGTFTFLQFFTNLFARFMWYWEYTMNSLCMVLYKIFTLRKKWSQNGSIPGAVSWYIPRRQLTVHWQTTMVKFHRDSSFTPPESQNCLVGNSSPPMALF